MATKRKIAIPTRNRSPYGWWVASYIERFEYKDQRPRSSRSRCLAYENTILITGKNREVAYRKALRVAKEGCNKRWTRYGESPGRLARWVFEGLTSLVAVYEKIEDGCEILWSSYPNISVGKLRRHVKSKNMLETFEDDDV